MTTLSRKRSGWTPVGIFAMVLGFALWWPLGLAIIGYMMWGGSVDDLLTDAINNIKRTVERTVKPAPSSGNAAFDAYREETLRRLEQEQVEFDEYVAKLRAARDREEFERFMKERTPKQAKTAK